jgi:hypothetical protein
MKGGGMVMKKFIGTVGVVVLCMSLMATPVFAALAKSSQSSGRSLQPYGYYPGYNPYGSYGGYNGAYNPAYGCGAVDPSRYPGSTEYCTKWIPGHWVSVRVMIPGRWVYRPVWIPGYPTARRQWVPGFWQTTAYHSRPDVYVWGAPQSGWYGIPYQNYQSTNGGYFGPNGVWVPTTQKEK